MNVLLISLITIGVGGYCIIDQIIHPKKITELTPEEKRYANEKATYNYFIKLDLPEFMEQALKANYQDPRDFAGMSVEQIAKSMASRAHDHNRKYTNKF